jgi:hypothetical protein
MSERMKPIEIASDQLEAFFSLTNSDAYFLNEIKKTDTVLYKHFVKIIPLIIAIDGLKNWTSNGQANFISAKNDHKIGGNWALSLTHSWRLEYDNKTGEIIQVSHHYKPNTIIKPRRRK